MYNSSPYNERKQKASNHQSILLNNDLFDRRIENEGDNQSLKNIRLSSKNNVSKFSVRNLNHKKNIKINANCSNSINKFGNEEKDYYDMNAKERENFLKLRGRKIKDYLNDFLKKNQIEENIENEEELDMEKFCLDNILNDNLMNSNAFNSLIKIGNAHNQSRSRTSGPIPVDFKMIHNMQNHKEEMQFNKIEEINKPRTLTFSNYNQYLKTKNKKKFSNDNVANEQNKYVPLKKRKKIPSQKYSQLDSSITKSLQSSDSRQFMVENKTESMLNLTYKLSNKKGFASVPSSMIDENGTNNMSLNKNLSSQKINIKCLVPCNIKILEKRGFIKFKNVYDSLSDDENEEYRSYRIYPDSEFKEIWDYIIFFITIYTLVYVPYAMAFTNTSSMIVIFIDLICDLIYIADVIIQFIIPIILPEDKYDTLFSSIAKNYIATWFILDFFSSIPLSSVINLMNLNISYSATSNTNAGYKITTIAKLSRIYRMMKLIRLLKLIKITKNDKKMKYMNLQNSNRSNLTRLFIFLLYFLVFNHMLACIWVFVGGLDYPNWIVESNLSNSSDLDLYVASIYFNLTTIFTVGYGDIISINNYERIYNIIIMCVGIMLYTFAVSSLSNLFQKKDLKTKKLENNLAFLDDISGKHTLNNKLYSKIKQCLKYDYTVNKEDKFNMLSNLPEIIKIDLVNEMHKDIINSFLFFKNTNSAFRAMIIMMLKPLKVLKGEVLIKENEFVEEMFFIKKGVLSIRKNYKERPLKLIEIRRNEHFGEIFMLVNERSSFGLVVKSKYAELFVLKKVDLFGIYIEYQSILESILQKSAYNSLVLLNRYKNCVNSFKDRRNQKHLRTEKSKFENLETGIFKRFLRNDDEINNSGKNSANLLKVSSKEKMRGIPIEENHLSHSPREDKFQEDFNIIIEENEDEAIMNFSDENKNIVYITPLENTQTENRESKCSYFNQSTLTRTNKLKSSNIKSSIFDDIKYSIMDENSDNESYNPRTSLRRLTEIDIRPKKPFQFEKIKEISKKFVSTKLLPTEKACSPLNIGYDDKSIRRESLLLSKEISKNIINDCMNIQAPAMLDFNKFEKWILNNQIKKLESILITFQQIVKKVEG